ncbi:MAG: c-type cytochrome [Caulobacteraceae bacterium]
MRRVLSLAILSATVAASSSAALAQATGDPVAGAALFEDRCVMCHLAAGGGQGPSLTGVFGRKAGTVAGFHYTPALKASAITWTFPELDRFLAGPGKAVPGTAMAVTLHDPRQRADLIAWLASRKARP